MLRVGLRNTILRSRALSVAPKLVGPSSVASEVSDFPENGMNGHSASSPAPEREPSLLEVVKRAPAIRTAPAPAPTPMETFLQPRIAVVGVGGAGSNAVNNMIAHNLTGCEFVVANTDAQALAMSTATRKLQLGMKVTAGLGAGAKPDVGRTAAQDSHDDLAAALDGCHMAFITAGMGGGTGTGAAPVVAKAASDLGILTVGVVTKPFLFEGAHRSRVAEAGLQELERAVDAMIVVPNQNLFRLADRATPLLGAFKLADDVLYSGVKAVTDLITTTGLVNLDFADVKSVMAGMGRSMMGTGEADGDERAVRAAEIAIANPLLEDYSLHASTGVLINITGGSDMTLFEVDAAARRVQEAVAPEANIIFGSAFDESLEGRIRVSIVATGIEVAV